MKSVNNIALFCNTLHGGGAENVMVTLANSFLSKNLKVTFIVCFKTGELIDKLHPGITVIELKQRTRFAVLKLSQVIRQIKPEILLSTQTHVNILSIVSNLILLKPTKVVIREASTPSLSESKDKFLKNILKKLLYSKSDQIVSVSEESKQDIGAFYNISIKKIHNIYNPIYSNKIVELGNEKTSFLEFKKENKVIVGMGRLVPVKDFVTLIKAFSKVSEQIPNSLLVILGSKIDAHLSEYKKIIKTIDDLNLKNKVYLEGFVENPFAYLSKASLFVLSSKHEGLPGSLIQAMACGCPVVSTSCKSGPTEILLNGKIGPLVPIGNPDALSRKMVEVLENPPDPHLLINRAKEFDLDTGVNKYLELFNRLHN